MAVYSVSQVTAYLRDILEEDCDLQSLSVRGEISNTTRAASGHWYFTLKDSQAQLRCVLWRNQADQQQHEPREGASFIVTGRVSLYEARGDLQLYVSGLQPVGLGALYQQFMESKIRLEAEGLFDPERKLPLPPYPHTIGIVTSPDAAALQDMRQVLDRRYPCAQLLLSPSPVQGATAAPALRQALLALIADSRAEVILLSRGGGSLEDLWPFNDEELARAVAASPVPIVSGIGHETDFTLVDFAADLRAPTPSAAAELATPDGPALREQLRHHQTTLVQRFRHHLAQQSSILRELGRGLQRHSPRQRIGNYRQLVDDRRAQLTADARRRFTIYRERARGREQKLAAINPLSILSRGYAYVTRVVDGTQVIRASTIQAGEVLDLHFQDGRRRTTANEE